MKKSVIYTRSGREYWRPRDFSLNSIFLSFITCHKRKNAIPKYFEICPILLIDVVYMKTLFFLPTFLAINNLYIIASTFIHSAVAQWYSAVPTTTNSVVRNPRQSLFFKCTFFYGNTSIETPLCANAKFFVSTNSRGGQAAKNSHTATK